MLNDTPRLEKSVCAEERDHRRSHRIAIVLDDIDDRQLPQLGHVEAFIDLALVRRAVAEISQADGIVAAIFVGESEPGAERHLGADDAVAAVEFLLQREHVHGAALALGIAAAPAGQLRHHALSGPCRRPAYGRDRDSR